MSIDQTFAHTIVSVSKDKNGEIVAYKLENGEVISKEQAVIMAKQSSIKGVSVAISKLGEEFLKSLPDGDINNNLENLPVIESENIE
ncbi:DUF3892 domain-containing protein [Clostridium rectalis]|uniref:DUF3892 domain-containing protein n=1 Tax=Clostridium rectalis TaxID=2040295 RepID=UPI000F63AED8|nr:DUF3892 domain-containing protein [Clostridium rectalis]